MQTPSYLVQNRFGTFYFRFSIPLKFQGVITDKSREFRRSLGTSQRREALMLARVWWVRVQAMLLDFEHMAKDSDKPKEDLREWFKDRLIKAEAKSIAEKQIRERNKKEKLNRYIREFGGDPSQSSHSERPNAEPNSPLLSELINNFIKDRVREQKWGIKAQTQNRATLELFKRIVGDLPIRHIKREHTKEFIDTLRRLPPNLNKHKQYKDKTIEEILRLGSPRVMSVTTVNHHTTRLASFFNWAKFNQLIENSPAQKLSIVPKKGQVNDRESFDQEDIKKIFLSAEFLGRSKHKPSTASFWATLIAAFTGMRLNEICQLHITDIREDPSGVWYISVNQDHSDKRLKTSASERDVPVHSKLRELGFLNYVEKMKEDGHERVFPELQYRQADGYGRHVSGWFTKYRKRVGVAAESKVFHCFRHTVSNIFKQNDIPEVQAAAVIGHDHDTMTYGNYGDRYSPAKLVKIVELIDYGIDFSPLLDPAVNPWTTTK